MKIFIDSADIDEISVVKETGILSGVTTNPILIKKAAEKRKLEDNSKSLEKYIFDL